MIVIVCMEMSSHYNAITIDGSLLSVIETTDLLQRSFGLSQNIEDVPRRGKLVRRGA